MPRKPRTAPRIPSQLERAAHACCRAIYVKCACEKAPATCGQMLHAAWAAINITDHDLAERLHVAHYGHPVAKTTAQALRLAKGGA